MNKLEKTIKKFKDNGFKFFGDETGQSISIDIFVILAYHKYHYNDSYWKVTEWFNSYDAQIKLETLDGFSYTFQFLKS